MASKKLRKPLAIGTLLAVGTLATFSANLATASHGGSGNVLSSSNGTPVVARTSLGNLTAAENVTDASWSPDGCRAVYVSDNGDIATIRHNDGRNQWWINDFGTPSTTRSHPTWRGTGSSVLWSERSGPTEPWDIVISPSSYGFEPFVLEIEDNDDRHYTHPDAGPGGMVVFQLQEDNGSGTPTGIPSVYLYNPGVPAFTKIIQDARNPAISPAGDKVAFVRSDGTHDQIFVTDLSGTELIEVTSDAADHDNPVWSPDGQTIAFSTSGNAIATAPADGSGASSHASVPGLSGKPGYEPGNTNHVVRLFGTSRFDTAIATSRAHWATAGDPSDTRAPAKAVVLSRSDTFADALSGSALAAAKEGPLLLTPTDSLWPTTRSEILRLLGTDPTATVYLLGSQVALSQAVEDEVKAMGYNVVRLAGQSRFATSIAIANEIDPTPDLVLAATGMNFPDALAAGAAAGSYNVPGTGLSAVVVLTQDTVLPAVTKSYLDNLLVSNPFAVLFGIGKQGTAALDAGGYSFVEIWGNSRYETALYTGQVFFGGQTVVGVATGTNWPDALAGGALMATLNGPLLITPSNSNNLDIFTEFLLDVDCGSIATGLIFGSTVVVNAAIDSKIGAMISGPAGFTVTQNPTTLSGAIQGAQPSLAAVGSGGLAAKRSPAELKAAAAAIQEAGSAIRAER